MAGKFIGYSIGLEATSASSDSWKMVKVEVARVSADKIKLSVVSGRNLARMPGTACLSQDEYENMPAMNSAEFAVKALALCGWAV